MRLVVEEGSQSWVQEVPDGSTITVGRALTNSVIIEDTAASREHCLAQLDRLPPELLPIHDFGTYPVERSQALIDLAEREYQEALAKKQQSSGGAA